MATRPASPEIRPDQIRSRAFDPQRKHSKSPKKRSYIHTGFDSPRASAFGRPEKSIDPVAYSIDFWIDRSWPARHTNVAVGALAPNSQTQSERKANASNSRSQK